jgi:hypothetical protein
MCWRFVMSFACGILGILGGLVLPGNSRSGREILIVASLLALSDLPVGIALGITTLILLVPGRSTESAQTK